MSIRQSDVLKVINRKIEAQGVLNQRSDVLDLWRHCKTDVESKKAAHCRLDGGTREALGPDRTPQRVRHFIRPMRGHKGEIGRQNFPNFILGSILRLVEEQRDKK